MGAQDAEDYRGVAAVVPARPVLGDFVPAPGQFLDSEKGLSAAVITRLTEQWRAEQRAFAEVFPDSREQLCWFHRTANVLAAQAKSAHSGARKALADIWNAEDRRHAQDAVTAFKLIESVQARGCAVNAPELVALVRAGAISVNGTLVERLDEDAA